MCIYIYIYTSITHFIYIYIYIYIYITYISHIWAARRAQALHVPRGTGRRALLRGATSRVMVQY